MRIAVVDDHDSVRAILATRLLPIGVVGVAWTVSWLSAWFTGAGLAGDNILWTVAAFVAGASALVAARRPDNRESALSFKLFGAGALVWAFGQAGWTWY